MKDLKDKVWHLLQNNDGRYESIGSATAIKITDDRFLLISAEHVMEQKNICVPCKESFSENPKYELLLGQRVASKSEDWSCLILNKELFEKFCEGGYSHSIVGKADGVYTFAGFPISKNKTRKTMVQNRPYSYTGTEISKELYNSYKLDSSKYIGVCYDSKNTIDSNTGEPTQFPDPHGMSGGGIFNSKKELVGVITDQSEDGKIFWGIRISYILNSAVTSQITLSKTL